MSCGSSANEPAALQLPAQQAVFWPGCTALAYQLSQPAWYAVDVLAALLAVLRLMASLLGLAIDSVFEAERCLLLLTQVSCAGREHDLQACAAARWW